MSTTGDRQNHNDHHNRRSMLKAFIGVVERLSSLQTAPGKLPEGKAHEFKVLLARRKESLAGLL